MKWANANGGVNSHQVDIIVKDTRSDPATALSDVKELVTQDHISGLMVADNSVADAIAPYIKSVNLPVIGGQGYSTTTWNGAPGWFSVVTSFPVTVTGQAQVAKNIRASSYAAIACAEVSSCATAATYTKPVVSQLGLHWDGYQTVSASAPNYTASCVALKSASFINLILAVQTSNEVITDCHQQGYTGTFGICCTSFSQAELSKGTPNGVKIAGMLDAFPWWGSTPAIQTFRDAMSKYSPSTDYRTTASTAIWASLELFRKTVGGISGDITPASVMQAYNGIKDETLSGLLPGPLTFTAGKAAPTNPCFFGFSYSTGDKDPKLIPPPDGKSGNGGTGDLASTCLSA
jgi:branched-chain amino acid transport system substrate-binding protein